MIYPSKSPLSISVFLWYTSLSIPLKYLSLFCYTLLSLSPPLTIPFFQSHFYSPLPTSLFLRNFPLPLAHTRTYTHAHTSHSPTFNSLSPLHLFRIECTLVNIKARNIFFRIFQHIITSRSVLGLYGCKARPPLLSFIASYVHLLGAFIRQTYGDIGIQTNRRVSYRQTNELTDGQIDWKIDRQRGRQNDQ